MPDERIIEKLGKIKAHMESAQAIGSEAEAQAFAAMLQTLLTKHKLEMTDIQYSAHLQEEPVEEFECGGGYEYRDGKRFYKNYPDVEIQRRRVDWIESLGGVIANANSCALLCSSGTSKVWFVGRKSDAQIAEYLFITMLRAAEKISHQEYMKFRRQCRARDGGGSLYLHETHGFKASFLDGFIMRLMQRFDEEKHRMEKDHTGTALMRINKEALAVREYVDNKFKSKLRGIGGSRDFNEEGYRRGKKTADSVNLKANAVEGQVNKQMGGGR